MTKTRFILLLWALFIVSLPLHARELRQDNRVLRAGIDQEPTSLNRYYTIQAAAFTFIDLYLLPPWLVNDALQFVPMLVEQLPTETENGITLNENGQTVVRFTLAEWAVWSDGVPMSAADFVLPFAVANDGVSSLLSTAFRDIADVSPGETPQEVVVTFNATTPNWFDAGFYPLPEHALRDAYNEGLAAGTGLDNVAWNRAPTVANGPYTFAEWQSGSFMRFVRNDQFHTPPYFDEIIVNWYPDITVLREVLVNGDIDIAHNFQASDVLELVDDPRFVIDSQFNSGREAWWLNLGENGSPALKDVRVRRAIAMGLDRDLMVEVLLADLTDVTNSFWDGTPYENTDIEPVVYDPAGAVALLNAAGWRDDDGDGICEAHGIEGIADGTPLTLTHGTDFSPLHQDSQVVAQEMMRDICIDLDIRIYEPTVFSASYTDGGILRSGTDDILQFYGFTVYESIDAIPWFMCSNVPGADNPNAFNAVQTCWPELDALWMVLSTSLDADERQAAADEIQAFMAQELFWIGLWDRPQISVYSADLQDVRLAGQAPYWAITAWTR
ncbi:MAG: peptide ABC transporter substrate-binding protein [Anaerolineae bacterium]